MWFLFLINFSLSIFSQNTEIYIGVEKKVSIENIIIKDFKAKTTDTISIEKANEIKEIVRSDLLFSRYFKVIEIEEYIKSEENLYYLSKAGNYILSADIEVVGFQINLVASLFKISEKKHIFKKIYSADINSIRRLSHTLSDDIVENLVNVKGIATSRIVFSNDSTGYKEIYMIDYDGENLKQLTNHKSISIVPRWSNDGTKIFYTSYRYGNPDLFVIDFTEGKIKLFSKFQGLNIAGGTSPDNSKIILTMSRGKDPSIYTIEIQSKEIQNLISNFGVCASPTFSSDGKEVAFISDRPGNPQLYIYNLETKTYRKLTNFYWADSPNWSNSGKWIVFSGRETKNENLNIFITDPTTSRIIRLTRNEGDNEDPSFSPDSRFITFISTRNGKRDIYIMDIDGSAPHLLSQKIKGNSYTPMWSR
jgi:TolB protein